MQLGLPLDGSDEAPRGNLPAPSVVGPPVHETHVASSGPARSAPSTLPSGVASHDAASHVSTPLEPIYFVRHRRARRYVLRVDPDGRLRITIPRGGSRREAGDFAMRHADWVFRQRRRMEGGGLAPAVVAEGRARAQRELLSRAMALADVHGVSLADVIVRNQRARWGSCGRNGRISLNWRLVLMPDWVRDYVIVHELMHLRRFDHSPHFWALVEGASPRYREARQWLRRHGPGLR